MSEELSDQGSLLEARQIGRQTTAGQWLIRNVSLAVHPGDRIAIVGPTGSGKTLFLRSLAILDDIQEGELRFHGNPLKDKELPEFRSQVVYLQQRPVLIEGTVEDNLKLALGFQVNQHKPHDIKALISLLNTFDRPESFLQRQSSALSGGEGQIVALLRALILSPQILLLDEPTSGLDPGTTKQFEAIILKWLSTSDKIPAFVWITHDHSQAERVARQIMTFPAGTILPVQKSH
ncbi:ABC transporter ATP-binding protein [Gimesia fumaroli]|uniref:Putative ABC transporter ATP-binding protein YbbL n=1 Tax=Gimesia fumaroli TaxID=2527976 RepID=A0A518IC94_9PLAN|nr:ATP-binding cassette domain-containing protein [Gimesia fumaroli]QDV50716.1 putative ABC transporter ATP-binding protein YbbL [Gimesia fumaroli]